MFRYEKCCLIPDISESSYSSKGSALIQLPKLHDYNVTCLAGLEPIKLKSNDPLLENLFKKKKRDKKEKKTKEKIKSSDLQGRHEAVYPALFISIFRGKISFVPNRVNSLWNVSLRVLLINPTINSQIR